MKKVIVMSVRPEWLAKILNGEKTVEIRTRVPKDFVGEIHLACTKGKEYLYYKNNVGYHTPKLYLTSNILDAFLKPLNDKVVAKFDYDYKKVEKLEWNENGYGLKYEDEIIKTSCVPSKKLYHYLQGKGFAIPLTNLAIFNKPRELGKYYTFKRKTIYSGMDCPPYDDEVKTNITRCPMSYQFAYVEEE